MHNNATQKSAHAGDLLASGAMVSFRGRYWPLVELCQVVSGKHKGSPGTSRESIE